MQLLSGPRPGTVYPLDPQVGYMSGVRVELLLTAVVGLGALSIDMFLPSLPAIATAFAAPPSMVQLTVTLFLMAFAFSQLVYGPLSDRYGRRGVLLGGLVLYALAGLACAMAPGVGVLIGARVLQALGAAPARWWPGRWSATSTTASARRGSSPT